MVNRIEKSRGSEQEKHVVKSNVSHLNVNSAEGSTEIRNALSQIENSESNEDSVEMGNVSQKVSSKKDGDIKGTSKKAVVDPAQARRLALINSRPSTKKMLSDINKHFKKEEKEISKTIAEATRNEDFYKLNCAVSRLRQITSLLSHLVYETYENLKAAWLKLVHNIV